MNIDSGISESGSLEYSLIRVKLNTLRIIEIDEKFTEISGYSTSDIDAGLDIAKVIGSINRVVLCEIVDDVRQRRLVMKRYKIRHRDGISSIVNCSFFVDENDDGILKIILTDMHENEREIVWAQVSRLMMCALNIYDGIQKSLEFIGRHLGLDRTTFVEFDPELTKITRSIQWSADEQKKTQDIIYNVKLGDVQSLGFTGSYVIYNDGECYPPNFLHFFKRFGVGSILGYAVHDSDFLYGFIFISSYEKRVWSMGQYELLQTISDVITSGLRKDRTEEMLWLSRENDRKILSCISTAVVVTDKETHEIIYKNSAARDYFPKMALGDKCYSGLCGRDTLCVNCPAETGGEYTIRNGKYRVNTSEMIWENKRRAYVLQLTKLSEMSREMTEKKYSFIYSKPCDIYYDINLIDGTCKVNILNEKEAYPLGELTGDLKNGLESFLDMFADNSTALGLREKIFSRSIEKQGIENIEAQLVTPSGEKVWFNFRAAHFSDENNTYLFVTARNITERKRIMQYETYHRLNVNKSAYKVYPFVLTVDIDTGKYSVIQNESKHIDFASKGDYADYHSFFTGMIHEEDRDIYKRMMSLENLDHRFRVHGGELTFLGRVFEKTDEEYHWLSMLAVRVADSEENVKVVMMGRYIDTERNREIEVREQLDRSETANRSRNAFLSRMSHDMRTPLNSIINMTELARKNITIPVLAEECLEKSGLSSRYLLALVNNVLDLSRYENGKMVLNRDVINVEQLLREIEEMVGPEVATKNQHFCIYRRNITNETVYGDETRLKQVLMNLITNAIKFSPEGGRIDVSVEETSNTDKAVYAVFRVADNGIGISKEFQKRLFIPFEQEHAGNRTYGGTGLGLSICRALLDAMGGKISVFSVEGNGTEFEVRMAFERCEPVVTKKEEPKKPLKLVCSHVLLVEDDKINAEIAEMLLSAENVQSEIAFNGKMAIEKFEASEENYYDAILMDIQMPVMDGLEATKQIRALKRGDARSIPIIAMTANVYIRDIEEAKAYGMTDHIQKPVNPKLLYAALQKCCEKH